MATKARIMIAFGWGMSSELYSLFWVVVFRGVWLTGLLHYIHSFICTEYYINIFWKAEEEKITSESMRDDGEKIPFQI